jgi:hypothetical protein
MKHFEPDDLIHSLKTGIVMKKEKVVFNGRLGNQAIDCAISEKNFLKGKLEAHLKNVESAFPSRNSEYP